MAWNKSRRILSQLKVKMKWSTNHSIVPWFDPKFASSHLCTSSKRSSASSISKLPLVVEVLPLRNRLLLWPTADMTAWVVAGDESWRGCCEGLPGELVAAWPPPPERDEIDARLFLRCIILWTATSRERFNFFHQSDPEKEAKELTSKYEHYSLVYALKDGNIYYLLPVSASAGGKYVTSRPNWYIIDPIQIFLKWSQKSYLYEKSGEYKGSYATYLLFCLSRVCYWIKNFVTSMNKAIS